MRLLDLYNKLLSRNKITFDECLEFVNIIIDTVNPGKKCEYTMLELLSSVGVMSNIINECCNIIYRNPKLFNITTFTLSNNDGVIKKWGIVYN